MGGKAYVLVNGQRLAPAVAVAFYKMAETIRRERATVLRVVSGTRLASEQEAIFRARYTLAPNGRRVYDSRFWQGRWWHRISPAGTVAVPGTSLHESDRAVDIGGGGVAIAGTADAVWIRANARRFGFAPNGYNFGEPWHIEYQGDPWAAVTGQPAATSGSNNSVEDDDMPIAILERTNSALTKSLYDVRTGKAIRAISRDENTAFRAGVSTGAVVYITVSDAEYTQRGGK